MSGFESLVREGCDHMARSTLSDSDANENLYIEVGKVANATMDKMLDRMWSPFWVEVACKRSMAKLEQVSAPRHIF
jgi:hypothetical protein